ncbi:endolytic transglycosylase MltG [Psychrobacter lutiphocae]|uniref:endolytic transglycosylase MltG n=1 Tax=Psychrobacter lutiphocae TaxID=540500 RepID=UPI00037969EE|nr:endolytic transglycosylase MltG [Psychrobacter lutiphocae]
MSDSNPKKIDGQLTTSATENTVQPDSQMQQADKDLAESDTVPPSVAAPTEQTDSTLTDMTSADFDQQQDSVSAKPETQSESNSQLEPEKQTEAEKQTELDSKTVAKTDVSLVCDDHLVHKEPPPAVTSRFGYQLRLVLGLMLAFVLAMGYQTFFGHSKQPAGELTVAEGQSYYGFLPQFQRDVPMFSASLAKLYIRFAVTDPLHAGTYDVPENASLVQLIKSFQQGQKIQMLTVQIIEGKRAADLYQVLANIEGISLQVLSPKGVPQENLKQALGIDAFTPEGEFVDNLEGWFAPNTYHYAPGTTDKQILTDLYRRQQKTLDEAWENRDPDLPYKTPYEALIMASIIEKETSVPSERNLVSAVFVNRINQGMRLQTDPTIIYGMGDRYDGNIRRKDINEKTAYNTYQIDGLPPTPIALPSQASIEAAMHPADSDALYFVATGTGGHKFSKTLAEHNRAVQEYLRVMREKKRNEQVTQPTQDASLQEMSTHNTQSEPASNTP